MTNAEIVQASLEVRFYSTPITTKDFLWFVCLSISTNVWSLSRNLCNWIPSWFLKGKLEKHQKSEVLHKRTRKYSITRKLILFSASINPEWLKTAMFCFVHSDWKMDFISCQIKYMKSISLIPIWSMFHYWHSIKVIFVPEWSSFL